MINLIDLIEIISIASFTLIVLLVIITILGLLFGRPKRPVERPRKASLPPLHGGYKALPPGHGSQSHPDPPKAPTGRGAGSH